MLGVLAASPELHGHLHDEAGEAGHTCAITLFSGGVDHASGGTEIAVNPALFPAGDHVAAISAPRKDAEGRLPPVCGPPLC